MKFNKNNGAHEKQEISSSFCPHWKPHVNKGGDLKLLSLKQKNSHRIKKRITYPQSQILIYINAQKLYKIKSFCTL